MGLVEFELLLQHRGRSDCAEVLQGRYDDRADIRPLRLVQQRFKLPVTGVFNAGTAAVMKKYGYTIIA